QFVPHAGRILHFMPPSGVRMDHAIEAGLDVPPFYDSMLGKVVAHAATRSAAIDQLAAALDRTQLLGIPTNRRFLAACLRDERFRAGEASIAFIGDAAAAIREQLAHEDRQVAVEAGLAAFDPPAVALACPFPRPARLRV